MFSLQRLLAYTIEKVWSFWAFKFGLGFACWPLLMFGFRFWV